MPMSFGKKPVKRGPVKTAAPPPSDSAGGVGGSLLGKRPALQDQTEGREEEKEEDEEDDGLTIEERKANLEAERKAKERRELGLGSSSSASSSDDDDSDDEIGPPLPPSTNPSTALQRPEAILPPMTNLTPISGTHTKTLSALAVDPSGSRFALGSYDYSLSLYDFGGLTPPAFSPFRLFEPTPNYPILDLSFSPSSTHLLVIPGTAQAKIFTRDGAELGECKKGDPYLRDMRNTSGHVSSLTCGAFLSNGGFVTGGSDSTVRIWDVETRARGQKDVVVVKSKTRGGRTKVTALQTSGETLVVGGEDGALTHWDMRSNLNSKPRGGAEKAHEVGMGISSIVINDRSVVTRGGDGKVKVWDLRSFRAPVVERGGLELGSPHTSVIFDPFGGNSVLTCTSSLPSEEGAGIVVLDTLSLDPIASYPIGNEYSTPIRLHWSSSTDQLFTTTRSGTLLIHHSSTRSSKGILLSLSRTPSSRSNSSLYIDPSISSVESYPIFSGNTTDLASGSQSDSAKRRKLAKARKDPSQTNLPQPPISGPGKGGRIGVGAMTHVVKSIVGDRTGDIGEDPREALLKYANSGGDGDQGEFTKAWKKTQPQPIYSKHSEEEEEEDSQ